MMKKLLFKDESLSLLFAFLKQTNLLIVFAFFMFLQTSFAQVTISPWKMNKGGGIITYSLPNHGNPAAYALATIPSPSDSNWVPAPTNASGGINFSAPSILSQCLQQLDFTYFETSINIPANLTVSDLKILFTAADDGARAYIFNSDHPAGAFIGQISLGQNAISANYAPLTKAGEVNRLVIVQFDDCPTGNNLTGAIVKVNGIPAPINTGGCTQSNFFWSNAPLISGNTASGTINNIGYTYTSSLLGTTTPQNVLTTADMFQNYRFPASYNVPNANPTIKNVYKSSNTLTFASPMTNPVLVFSSIGQPNLYVPIQFSAPVEILWQTAGNIVQNSSSKITGNEGFVIIRMNGTFSSISFDYLADENYVNFAFGADFSTTFPDTVGPVITLNGNATESINVSSTPYTDPGATATDNCSTPTVIVGGTVNTNLPGVYTLTYDATDASGNAATQVTRTVTVVDPVPVVVTQNITVNLDANGNASITPQQIDNGSSVTFSPITLSLDAGQGQFTCANVGVVNTVNLVVTDAHGNSAFGPAIVTVQDNVAPTVLTQDLNLDLDGDGLASIVASQIDNGSTDACGIASVTVSPNTFNCANIGANAVTLTVTDIHGNVATGTANVTISDSTPPTVITQNVTVYLDANGQGSVTAAQINNLSTDACGIDPTKFGLSATAPRGQVVMDVTNISCSNVGDNTVVLNVTDIHGNTATGNAIVTVVDNIAPVIVAPADISVFATSAQGATVNYTAPVGTDNCSVTTALTTAGFGVGATFPIGTTLVTYTATDASGNAASASFNVEVVGIPPVIVCPADITVSNDLGLCEAIVNYAATETTAIPASVITYDITSGSSFAVGTTTVTATATNAVGTSICSFTVTVNDTELPTVNTQAFTTTITGGVATVTTADVDNGSSDNCGIASMDVSPNTFVCGDQGDHIVTLTVTDIHGNTNTNTATVTILGDVPTISIADFTAVPTQNSNTIYLGYGPQSMALTSTTTGGTGFTYNWVSSTGELVASEANPTVSPLVTTTYTVTVTNDNGCDATTSIDVCVIDARYIDEDGEYEGKVLVCHHEGHGNNDRDDDAENDDDHESHNGTHNIEVSQKAVKKHLEKHGDTLGACGATCSTVYVVVVVEHEDDDHGDNDHADNDDDKGDDNDKGKDDDKSKSSKNKTVIYPNPTVDEVTVSLDKDGQGTIEIYNDRGQRIYKKKTKNLKKGIKYNMRGKKTGSYFTRIKHKGKVYTAIIFKKE